MEVFDMVNNDAFDKDNNGDFALENNEDTVKGNDEDLTKKVSLQVGIVPGGLIGNILSPELLRTMEIFENNKRKTLNTMQKSLFPLYERYSSIGLSTVADYRNVINDEKIRKLMRNYNEVFLSMYSDSNYLKGETVRLLQNKNFTNNTINIELNCYLSFRVDGEEIRRVRLFPYDSVDKIDRIKNEKLIEDVSRCEILFVVLLNDTEIEFIIDENDEE